MNKLNSQKIYVVQDGAYEDRYIVGVYSSPKVAFEKIKKSYDGYLVTWSNLSHEGFMGSFEDQVGFAVKHKAFFSITEYNLDE